MGEEEGILILGGVRERLSDGRKYGQGFGGISLGRRWS